MREGLFDGFFNNPHEAAADFTQGFREISAEIISRGIKLERLRVLPQVGFRNVESRHLHAEVAMRRAAQKCGEISRFVWYDDKLVNDLVRTCGLDSDLARRYLYGAEQGVPRASLWVARRAGGAALHAARVMDYAEDDPSVMQTSSLYLAPIDHDLLTYESYWKSVYCDESRSFDLWQALGLISRV